MEQSVCKLFIFMIYVTFLFVFKCIESKEEPKFMVDIDRFEKCNDSITMAMPLENLKFYKINRTTRAFSFDTHLTRPIDERVGLKTELERWGTHGWTKVPFMPLQPDACNLFHKLLGNTWTELKRSMGVKQPEKCPIPVGDYGLKNYTYDTTNFAQFVPFKGRFRYTIILMDFKSGDIMQCIILVMNVVDATY